MSAKLILSFTHQPLPFACCIIANLMAWKLCQWAAANYFSTGQWRLQFRRDSVINTEPQSAPNPRWWIPIMTFLYFTETKVTETLSLIYFTRPEFISCVGIWTSNLAAVKRENRRLKGSIRVSSLTTFQPRKQVKRFTAVVLAENKPTSMFLDMSPMWSVQSHLWD